MKKLFFTITAIVSMSVLSDSSFAQKMPEYVRSSVYSILINSDIQNQAIEKENEKFEQNSILDAVRSHASSKRDEDIPEELLSSLPAYVFPFIEPQAQFNDHNFGERIVEYDIIKNRITPQKAEQVKKEMGVKSENKVWQFVKQLLTGVYLQELQQSGSSLIKNDEMGDYIPAVLQEYFNENQIAPWLVARWFNYDPEKEQKWDMKFLEERARQSLSVDEIKLDKDSREFAVGRKALNLLPQTYVVATNLRFRSKKAMLDEAQKLAEALINKFTGVAIMGKDNIVRLLLGTPAGAIAGEGFRVEADTYLFRLVWNKDLEREVARLMDTNGSIDELINSGLCKLEFVDKQRQSVNVRRGLNSTKSYADLVCEATTRAVDKAIVKLQENNEAFRSVFPITNVSESEGTVDVEIGRREGVRPKNEYEILEMVENDKTGEITYKAIGKAKVEKNPIWNNIVGVSDADNNKEDDAYGSSTAGFTRFNGPKNKDFTGCLIRLKKASGGDKE